MTLSEAEEGYTRNVSRAHERNVQENRRSNQEMNKPEA